MTPDDRQTAAIKAVSRWVKAGKPSPRTWVWDRSIDEEPEAAPKPPSRPGKPLDRNARAAARLR